ncbi:hypothetical protein BGW38_010641 [Lunasporangiospora selenospora]|uniref:Secreted protein n=1 Tax=Lunasporangiospora selenospora TaxID=979761 RepID=A0A9P6FWP0_9FUNG|nr:hypothetical protein BGW38_010641 [Lunasporangiospora selenospora]
MQLTQCITYVSAVSMCMLLVVAQAAAVDSRFSGAVISSRGVHPPQGWAPTNVKHPRQLSTPSVRPTGAMSYAQNKPPLGVTGPMKPLWPSDSTRPPVAKRVVSGGHPLEIVQASTNTDSGLLEKRWHNNCCDDDCCDDDCCDDNCCDDNCWW